MPTPHNRANIGDFAKTVLMPGDPLRAKFVADKFLENARLINDVRGMLAYTGTYKGVPISVMGSGMGMPSIGIYSYELYNFYGVENIIRIGTAGAYDERLNIFDVVLADGAYSESTYAKTQYGFEESVMPVSAELNARLIKSAEKNGVSLTKSIIHSGDVFYYGEKQADYWKTVRDNHGCVCVEMESFALLANARYLGKNAACIVTISDSLAKKCEEATAQQRQTSLEKMIKVALDSVLEGQ